MPDGKPHGKTAAWQCGSTGAYRPPEQGARAQRGTGRKNAGRKAALPEEPEENPAAGGVIKRTKRPIRKRHGVPVEPEVCLSEASDIMCRATYRAIKLACDTDGGNGGEAACAKSLKEYWAVLKEALSVTGSIKDGEDGENVLRVVMDESADRFSE